MFEIALIDFECDEIGTGERIIRIEFQCFFEIASGFSRFVLLHQNRSVCVISYGKRRVVLNRRLAESGHYPAIDIEQSISRAMHTITSHEHQLAARKLKQLYSRFERSRDLISVGAYAPGSDPTLDQAIALHEKIEAFLCQEITEKVDMHESLAQLTSLFH